MIYNNIDIRQIDEEMFILKNIINQKYIKLGVSELKYLLSELNIKAPDFNLKRAKELDTNSKNILKSKFVEWGFISGKEMQPLKKYDKSKDCSKIVLLKVNPSGILDKIPDCIIKMFSKCGLFVLILFLLIKLPMFFYGCERMLYDVQHYEYSFMNLIFLGILSLISTLFHEMGHAISCTKFGGKVSSMGILLFFFFPCFFVDVSDIYMLNSRKKSMCVAASGLMVNMILGSISFYLYYLFSLFNINCSTLLIFYFCSVGNVVYNLIPFVKLDGYWIFSSAIQVTNLIEKSVLMFFTAIFKFNEYSKVDVSNAKKLFLTFWGFICIIFRPIFWILSTFTVRNFINNISHEFSVIVIILFTLIVAYNEFKFILYHIKKFKNNRKNILEMI